MEQIRKPGKCKSPQNIIQLIEWIRLGRRHFINELFLQYIDIISILSLCSISKHYYRKYISYSINYYFVKNTPLRNIFVVKLAFDEKQEKKGLVFYTKSKFHQPLAIHRSIANTHAHLYQANKYFRHLTDNYYLNADVNIEQQILSGL